MSPLLMIPFGGGGVQTLVIRGSVGWLQLADCPSLTLWTRRGGARRSLGGKARAASLAYAVIPWIGRAHV